MEKITKAQAEELYGEVPLYFTAYYKYVFTYAGEAPDGVKIVLSYGGDSDDIYRFEVFRTKPVTMLDGYTAIEIRDGENVIFEETNWGW